MTSKVTASIKVRGWYVTSGTKSVQDTESLPIAKRISPKADYQLRVSHVASIDIRLFGQVAKRPVSRYDKLLREKHGYDGYYYC